MHVGISAADVPVKFHNDNTIIKFNKTSYQILKQGPEHWYGYGNVIIKFSSHGK